MNTIKEEFLKRGYDKQFLNNGFLMIKMFNEDMDFNLFNHYFYLSEKKPLPCFEIYKEEFINSYNNKEKLEEIKKVVLKLKIENKLQEKNIKVKVNKI